MLEQAARDRKGERLRLYQSLKYALVYLGIKRQSDQKSSQKDECPASRSRRDQLL